MKEKEALGKEIVISENEFARKILALYYSYAVLRYEVRIPGGEPKCTDAVPMSYDDWAKLSAEITGYTLPAAGKEL